VKNHDLKQTETSLMLPKFGDTSFAPLHYSQLAITYVSLQNSGTPNALSVRTIPPLSQNTVESHIIPVPETYLQCYICWKSRKLFLKVTDFSDTPVIMLACNQRWKKKKHNPEQYYIFQKVAVIFSICI